MDKLMLALSRGKLCIMDVSQMRGGQSLILSGLILRRIFDRNQEQFTAADPKTIPTIAVVEEAQSVLNENAPASEPYVAWVKEGRKYDLGALLITQQPGSIPVEILSQGDNWFMFHLLSAADLSTLKRANAHFSDDLLSSLLNEPIEGQGVFWSSVGGKPYPISLRASSFQQLFSIRDPEYARPAGNTFARQLLETVPPIAAASEEQLEPTDGEIDPFDGAEAEAIDGEFGTARPVEAAGDAKSSIEARAIATVRARDEIMEKLTSEEGMAWYGLQVALMEALPEYLDDKRTFAYNLMRRALNEIFGNQGWETYRHPRTQKTWVRRK